MKHLWYLVAAYSSVWVVLGAYIFVLIKRNGRLLKQVEELEHRLSRLDRGN